MKPIFHRIPNNKVLHFEKRLSAILFQRKNCYPATGHVFCVMPVTNDSNTNIPMDSQCNDGYLEIVGNCRRSNNNGTFLYILLCFFNFGRYKLHSSVHNTTRERHECFHCAFRSSTFVAICVVRENILHNPCLLFACYMLKFHLSVKLHQVAY